MLTIKKLLREAFEMGKLGATDEQFQEWYELQGDTNKIIEASTNYVETRLNITISSQTKTTHQKNVIIGGTITAPNGFHLGDTIINK
jgi:hypothetical protein